MEPYPGRSPPNRGSPQCCRSLVQSLPSSPIRYPGQHPRRATVVGAGSFGTAVAVLIDRAGIRTTLLCRTREQAKELSDAHENRRYLSGVELPRDLRVSFFGDDRDDLRRSDLIL